MSIRDESNYELTKLKLENRIKLLNERGGPSNARIVKKLERLLARMEFVREKCLQTFAAAEEEK